MPPLTGLLETAIYADNKAKVVAFFQRVMGLKVMREDERFTALDAGNNGVRLIFTRGGSVADTVLDRGTIPGHDGHGPLHMAFAIPAGSYDAWRDHLRAAVVCERGEMQWPSGGKSFYFEDPEGHVLEVATPGVWPNY
jgi:catechol 2,3-dioxygenase-like lactoylglutathione lyase family enzyme